MRSSFRLWRRAIRFRRAGEHVFRLGQPNAQLVSGLASFPDESALWALVEYRNDGAKATLVGKLTGLDTFGGQTLDLTIDGALVTEFVAPATGTFSFSFDSSKGDAVVAPASGSVLLLTRTDGSWVGIGNFHA